MKVAQKIAQKAMNVAKPGVNKPAQVAQQVAHHSPLARSPKIDTFVRKNHK